MDFSFVNHLRKIDNEDERIVTITLLIDVISNLLDDRKSRRHHTLPAKFIEEMFSHYSGAMQCLRLVGFKQIANDYVFDQTTTDEQLKEVVKRLESELEWKSSCSQSEPTKCASVDLGTIDERSAHSSISFTNLRLPSAFTNVIPFLSTLQRVQSYEDINLRRYIRSSIIPLEEFNRKISQRKLTSDDIDKRDLLLLELLRWFKEEFFTWFEPPHCDRCRIVMDFAQYAQPTREEREQGDAQRVELYRCSKCSSEHRFPRFNAPSKLLETRRGRCGEAANLFACLCRALSFPTRYIYDPSDHVWTEVYSEHQRRWMHCDSCENLCDSPLVYEKGWKKSLKFCIAFAKDHIADVTWRYVENFEQTRRTRNINEKLFAKTIHRINERIATQMDQMERKKITNNLMEDIVSMLKENKDAKESELHGRQSGSAAWRLARGEVEEQDDITNGYTYLITDDECESGSVCIAYDSVLDKYFRNQIEETNRSGWIDRVHSCSNVQRKVERDWKMVYLARKNLNTNGVLTWSMQLQTEQEKDFRFDRITIQCPSVTFDEHAKIVCQLQLGDDRIIDIPTNSNVFFEYQIDNTSGALSDCRITFRIILSSTNDSNDSNAWQKAQLFRQSMEQTSTDDQSHFLKINLSLKKKQAK